MSGVVFGGNRDRLVHEMVYNEWTLCKMLVWQQPEPTPTSERVNCGRCLRVMREGYSTPGRPRPLVRDSA